MLIASPEDRVLLWRQALDAGRSERADLLRQLGRGVQDVIGGSLNLYAAYDDLFEETMILLDASGLLGRDTFRFAFESADEGESGPIQMALVLALSLRESVDVEHLDKDAGQRCRAASAQWTQLIEDHIAALSDESSDPQTIAAGATTVTWCSVALVAAQFGVTPQAVYRWIDKDKIEYERSPGGSYRVPAEQFDDTEVVAALRAGAERGVSRTPSARLDSAVGAAHEEVVDDRERVDPSDPSAIYRGVDVPRRVRRPK